MPTRFASHPAAESATVSPTSRNDESGITRTPTGTCWTTTFTVSAAPF
jgi:hypothetical protein